MDDQHRGRFDMLRPGLKAPQPKYDFMPDSAERLEEITGGVECLLELADLEGRHTDPNLARERINHLYENKVGYINYFGSSSALLVKTDNDTYQKLSQAADLELADIIVDVRPNRRLRAPNE